MRKPTSLNSCLLCEKKFCFKNSLTRHVKSTHFTLSDVYTCHECERNFCNKQAVARHITRVHLEPRQIRRTIPCFKCNEGFSTLVNLISHLKSRHRLSIVKEMIQFPTVKDFHVWKKQKEESTHSKYVVYHTQKTKNGCLKKYICNRSGIFNPTSEGRLRCTKKSTRKIGQICTSHIHVNIINGSVYGYYFSTHTSHSVQLHYLPLMEWEEKYICEKFKKGLSCINVLRSIQNDAAYERRQSITYYQVYNIARKYSLLNIQSDESNEIFNANPEDKQNDSNHSDLSNVLTQEEIEELLLREQTLNSDYIKEYDFDDIQFQLISNIDRRIDDYVVAATNKVNSSNSSSFTIAKKNTDKQFRLLDNNYETSSVINKVDLIFRKLSSSSSSRLDNDKYQLINGHLDAILQILL